jgi:hypothetical protein
MRWKFWQAEEEAQPVVVEEAPAPTAQPEAAPEPEPEAAAEPEPEAAAEPEAHAEREPEVPTQITLTIDEAKGVIKDAGGDVIQVGFLASAYRRQLGEDPESAQTAASYKKLRELVGQRLKDRGLLASDGVLELRD